jgi:hypothetical protein
LLLGLAGCARSWFEEREPWRHEAEISCMKSGAVKEGPSIAVTNAIEGPGACGLDYPLRGTPAEQGFLYDVQGAACTQFATVLAPGSNAYHEDHMHVDLMRRSSGRSICEPAALPGEAASFRAGGHYGGARHAEAAGAATARH